VYSHAFMLWLAALCLLFLGALLAERRQLLVFGTVLWLLLGLAGLDLVNPDRFIAEQNLHRYALGRPLDATHLTVLSADAAPVVLRAFDLAAERADEPVRDALGSGLRRQLVHLDHAAEPPWPTFNLARAEAHAALAARRAELDAYPLRRGT
jgi:hypothetical protein